MVSDLGTLFDRKTLTGEAAAHERALTTLEGSPRVVVLTQGLLSQNRSTEKREQHLREMLGFPPMETSEEVAEETPAEATSEE